MAGSAASIAIADDDEAVRESLAALIEAHGFEVHVFASGRALLEGQASNPADCILVDRHMPHFTGLDVLEQLRASGDPTPLILMTGLPDSGLRAKARALGAFSVLQKPLTQAELLAALHGALAAGKR
jgi:FixJ family two-component response regulator